MKIDINLCAIFTEYQLLQAQAILSTIRDPLIENILILMGRQEIDQKLIDPDLLDSIFRVPYYEQNSSKNKLTKSYLLKVEKKIKDFIVPQIYNKNIRLIGAQDENTDYAILKRNINVIEYFNIEDGLANYYKPSIKKIIQIGFKKTLFKNVYGFDLELYKHFGESLNYKSFRICPELSENKGLHEGLKNYFIEYLPEYWPKIEKNYDEKDLRIPLNINEIVLIPDWLNNDEIFEFINKNPNKFYIPHPTIRKRLSKLDPLRNDIYVGALPLELLLFGNPHIKNVHFYSLSSSITNLLIIYDYILVNTHFKLETRFKKLITGLKDKYNTRLFLNG